jgi:hypothetical protein
VVKSFRREAKLRRDAHKAIPDCLCYACHTSEVPSRRVERKVRERLKSRVSDYQPPLTN